jgi:hypothetical protein
MVYTYELRPELRVGNKGSMSRDNLETIHDSYAIFMPGYGASRNIGTKLVRSIYRDPSCPEGIQWFGYNNPAASQRQFYGMLLNWEVEGIESTYTMQIVV